ncbi:MAG TPA: hypothetical protein PKX55_19470, partial [Leptospiraceae bacterium]|nr:hypothetical protein [Leptospiraceae bacterium]
MAEFDKTKKAIGVGGMAENERNEMFNKFKSAGGKVVKDKEDKPQQQPKNTQRMKAVGGKDDKSKSSSGDKKFSPGMYRGIGASDDDDDSSEVSISKAQIGAMDAEMSNFMNRLIIKFKCWANNVTTFGNKDLLPKFMSELRVEFQQALLEFKIAGSDILGNPQLGPKVTKELDRISPIYVELIGRAHKIYDTVEMNDLFADYSSNPDIPVPINRVAKPVYSIFKKLYYLYPYQATYRKAVLTAYEVLQRIENKPALIYATKKKKISSEISVVFDKIFEKLYYIIIRNENKNIPMVSLYMENLLNILESEKPGKRKAGENLPLDAGGEQSTEEAQAEEKKENPNEKKGENQELAYGRKLMSEVSIEQLRRKYDPRNELIEIPDTDKALLTYLFFKEFDYEYSFVLTTKKITIKPSNVNGTKVDNKQKLLNVYELTRSCMEQFKIYIDVFKEQAMHKANPGTNYIEASKKTTGLEQKRSQQSRNVRVTIKDYIEKSYDSFNMLIEDMKGPAEIVGNMEEVIVFDSIESKKRLHKKQVKQCIMEAYCYSYAFATRLTEGGDLYGGVIELTPEEM